MSNPAKFYIKLKESDKNKTLHRFKGLDVNPNGKDYLSIRINYGGSYCLGILTTYFTKYTQVRNLILGGDISEFDYDTPEYYMCRDGEDWDINMPLAKSTYKNDSESYVYVFENNTWNVFNGKKLIPAKKYLEKN